MRTIKFRAWNGVEMIYPNTNGWYNKLFAGDNGVMQDVRLGTMINSEDKGVVPMQFTGLLDKNGVEIYESDVVKHQDTYDPSGTHWVDVFEVVEFGGGAFNPICTMPGGEYEVIGNIHENPELL